MWHFRTIKIVAEVSGKTMMRKILTYKTRSIQMKISTRRRNTTLTSAKWQLTIESFRSPGKDFVRTKKGTFLHSLTRSLVRDEKTKMPYKLWTTALLYVCAKKPDAVDSDVASGSCRKETDREIVTVKTFFSCSPTN